MLHQSGERGRSVEVEEWQRDRKDRHMRLGLGVNVVWPNQDANVEGILALAEEAVDQGAEMILFGEAAVTGLITTDDEVADLAHGTTIPGPLTARLATWAATRRVWLGFGLLERDGKGLYDSAVLISDAGRIVLHYRRVESHWHGPLANPAVYRQGAVVPVTVTPWGRVAFLICGDLWDDDVLALGREAAPDLLLYPFARTFGAPAEPRAQARWNEEDMEDYAARIELVGCPGAMVNYLAHPSLGGPSAGCFGGAWMVGRDGVVAAEWPLGQPGVLIADIPMPSLKLR